MSGFTGAEWEGQADDFVMLGSIMSEQNLLTPDEDAESIAHREALAAAREEAVDEENDEGEDELS